MLFSKGGPALLSAMHKKLPSCSFNTGLRISVPFLEVWKLLGEENSSCLPSIKKKKKF